MYYYNLKLLYFSNKGSYDNVKKLAHRSMQKPKTPTLQLIKLVPEFCTYFLYELIRSNFGLQVYAKTQVQYLKN